MAGDVLLLNALLSLAVWFLALGTLGLLGGKSAPVASAVPFLQSIILLWVAVDRYSGRPTALPWMLAGGLVLLILAAIAYALLRRQPGQPTGSLQDLSSSENTTDV